MFLNISLERFPYDFSLPQGPGPLGPTLAAPRRVLGRAADGGRRAAAPGVRSPTVLSLGDRRDQVLKDPPLRRRVPPLNSSEKIYGNVPLKSIIRIYKEMF